MNKNDATIVIGMLIGTIGIGLIGIGLIGIAKVKERKLKKDLANIK